MNIYQTKSAQLEVRMLDFAMEVIAATKKVQHNHENDVIVKQLIRAASSIGANYNEANNAASKQDFRNKIFIAKKETAEARYWLKPFSRVNPQINTDELIDECSQFLFILQKIVSTMKNGK